MRALTYDHLGFREDIVMTTTGSANWRAAGACLNADPDLFFPISTKGPAEQQIMRAKMICSGCGVRRECLEFALSHDLVYGIWGGTTPEDRQRDRRRKRRAAAAAEKAHKRIVAVQPPDPRPRPSRGPSLAHGPAMAGPNGSLFPPGPRG